MECDKITSTAKEKAKETNYTRLTAAIHAILSAKA
jgi:hypothetical protein